MGFDRIHQVLWAVVDSYITTFDPVGSRSVTKNYDFNLSPATIRNIMADLEDLGFLQQPHTSSGRVPTDKGYRFYVDALFQKEEIKKTSPGDEITDNLENVRNDVHALLEETARALSLHCHYLGIALSPRPGMITLRQLKLLRYRHNQVNLTFLSDEGMVKSKIIHLDPSLTQQDLNRIADYLNSEFEGCAIDDIKNVLLKEMRNDKELCDTLISRAARVCEELLRAGYNDIFISGFSEVLGLPDFSDLERIREISRAIEDKHQMIKLLDMLTEAEGVTVVIGSENPALGMKKLSMVVSTYKEGNRPIGTIGVIGPTRMDYLKAIMTVDTTAKYISRILTERQ